MYKPYKKPVEKAYADISVKEPHVSRFVVFLIKLLGRLYLFLFYGVFRVFLHGETHLFDAFARALSGKSRCIVAFRHPNGGEPQILSWFFLFKLAKLAARRGVFFARRPHAVFVYGYEVVRWGGWAARFVMPNLGAMPIHHAKMDRQGMARIYHAIVDGPYPVALAPEGQVSYTTDSVPHLEPGVIRIGFHAAERLAAKGSDLPVEILPVSVHFRFGPIGKASTERLLKQVEKNCGFSGRERLSFTERLARAREYILAANEARYGIESDTALPFEERIERLIKAALETAERMIGVKDEGDFFSRIYALRQYCWDRIFVPGVENLEKKTRLDRGILDLRAGEAWHIGRHQELIDFCWYFRVPLPAPDAAFHNKIEYVQNLWDFANRTMGGAYSDRVSIFARSVIIKAAPSINLSARLPAFRRNRKAETANAMKDLEKAYLDCIAEVNRDKPD